MSRESRLLVGELVGDVLASGFFEHVAGSICLSQLCWCFDPGVGNIFDMTYDLLVDGAVLLCILSHGTTVLLLGSVKTFVLSALAPSTLGVIHTLVEVVFLLTGGSVVVGVGVHFEL